MKLKLNLFNSDVSIDSLIYKNLAYSFKSKWIPRVESNTLYIQQLEIGLIDDYWEEGEGNINGC